VVRHLALAVDAPREDDRDLAHTKAGTMGAIGQLDLEAIAGAARRVERQRLQHPAVEGLETGGQVMEGHAEDPARVPRADATDHPAPQGPMACAAGNPTRAEDEIGHAVAHGRHR
jgi:hypothetical protein